MKGFSLLIFIFMTYASHAQEFKDTNGITKVALKNGDHVFVPYVKINQHSFTHIEDSFFKHAVGGQSIKETTLVKLKFDDQFIEIQFECLNNPKLTQNSYFEDNSAMYNQEVFEIFISSGVAVPKSYLEIEINPNNALFIGRIYNHEQQFKNEFVDTDESGIVHEVKQDIENDRWTGYLKIPIDLIEDNRALENIYRLNFYRIISQEDHNSTDWKVDKNNATFACWSSTMSETPQFHVPDRFGFLILD